MGNAEEWVSPRDRAQGKKDDKGSDLMLMHSRRLSALNRAKTCLGVDACAIRRRASTSRGLRMPSYLSPCSKARACSVGPYFQLFTCFLYSFLSDEPAVVEEGRAHVGLL